MARQVIDTSPPIGTPAPTAFNMINAMTAELYGFNLTAGGLVAGQLRILPAPGGDQVFIRSEGASGVTVDAVNNANSAYAPVSIRGSQVNLNGPVNASGTISVPQNYASRTGNVVLATGGAGTVFLRPNGTDSGAGELTLSQSGVCSAPAFNPTSSADVKDFIEGYAGDADMDLNRLVVITHRYRPEFLDSEKTYLSLLAENVQSVVPIATDGNYDVVEKEPYERPVTITVQVPNEDGDATQDKEMETFETAWREVTRHVPMNVNLMSIVALCVRAHQSKDRRIRELEAAVADLQAIVRPAAGQTE